MMNVSNNEEVEGPGTEQAVSFSCHTLDKATKAKLTLENYYSNLISQHRERQERLKRLEESLSYKGLEELVINEKRNQHTAKETEFLRLKRSRLGPDELSVSQPYWERNGLTLSDSAELELTSVTSEDEGWYQCNANH